jgi:hypothetical protein
MAAAISLRFGHAAIALGIASRGAILRARRRLVGRFAAQFVRKLQPSSTSTGQATASPCDTPHERRRGRQDEPRAWEVSLPEAVVAAMDERRR